MIGRAAGARPRRDPAAGAGGSGSGGHTVCQAIAALKADAATQHIPVLAFAAENAGPLMEAAQKAGATLVAGETAMATICPSF